MDLPDEQILRIIQEGSETAFEMLFRGLYNPLCRYAYSFLNDRDESEEVVQAAFINLWDKRSAIEIERSAKAYLYRMVRNSCLNSIKHERVRQKHIAHEMMVIEQVHEETAQVINANELEERIYEALKALPEQCRIVFQLSRFEELKYAEIAGQLGISIKTVENQIGKALKIMREQLKDYLPVLLIIIADWICQ